jgi:crotonobetainyl-CoA:carnitine CoA-transferase CaiB-like acyl-CoA transferase
VLELGQIYNGPYCALLLAHHGADVIKVEPPQGDVLRRMDRSPGGASYPFLMLNANKRGITINLKHPRGRELFLQLAERADVEVEPRRDHPEPDVAAPPPIGAHTGEVLSTLLGMSAANIEALRAAGAI